MSDHQPSSISHQPSAISHRIVAVLEVVLCSDFVTQIAIGGTLTALGVRSHIGTRLNVAYVVALSIGDALLLVLLIVGLLLAHGERPRDVLFGRRRVAPEIVPGCRSRSWLCCSRAP